MFGMTLNPPEVGMTTPLTDHQLVVAAKATLVTKRQSIRKLIALGWTLEDRPRSSHVWATWPARPADRLLIDPRDLFEETRRRWTR